MLNLFDPVQSRESVKYTLEPDGVAHFVGPERNRVVVGRQVGLGRKLLLLVEEGEPYLPGRAVVVRRRPSAQLVYESEEPGGFRLGL